MPTVPRLFVAICVVLLLGAAALIVAVEEWHGPILLTLSAGHGVDTGDLLALPFLALALALAIATGRRLSRRRGYEPAPGRSPGWAGPASAIVLGVLLLLVGVQAKARGGPLVPAGGGTFDGVIEETFGTAAVPVDRWSHVAITRDAGVLRLYVNGKQVSSRATTGPIQITDDPLWIGGNRPYGEHFHGSIDEVRVYNRALGVEEIRDDLATPVAPAPGLVAGYAFDVGSGATAADSSGRGNTGKISGAAWSRGRYGNALRFDGARAVVRVPATASLDVPRAISLSAWIRPSAPQTGWRTIVQRQADAYLLTAGSDRQNRLGGVDDIRAAVVVAAIIWFCAMSATRRRGWTEGRRGSWWQPIALFVVGSLGDAVLAPTPSLIAPSLVALWLAATAPHRGETISFLFASAVFAGLTIASLADLLSGDGLLSRDDGSVARTAALGTLFVLAGVWMARRGEAVSGDF